MSAARKEPELVEPDERWQQMVGTHADLVEKAYSWPTDPRVKNEVAERLATCRALFAHSYFVYEFGVVAGVWSVFAVEAALRDCLGEAATQKDGLKDLIGKAQGRGWFNKQEADALRAGAELRNRFTRARARLWGLHGGPGCGHARNCARLCRADLRARRLISPQVGLPVG